jgi:thiol-disulfide isomerase/thioredoxin
MRPYSRRVLATAIIFTMEGAAVCGASELSFYDYGPAPEFAGIEQWLNSDPLSLAALRGKVVLVDFWTYSCINCLRTLPYVIRWYKKFKDRGLVVIGVHTPEFGFEKLTRNVQTAIGRNGITYPVAQDNQYATWRAFDNQYWPATYLIDRNGHVVLKHAGEGDYEETERAIEALLNAKGAVQ